MICLNRPIQNNIKKSPIVQQILSIVFWQLSYLSKAWIKENIVSITWKTCSYQNFAWENRKSINVVLKTFTVPFSATKVFRKEKFVVSRYILVIQ